MIGSGSPPTHWPISYLSFSAVLLDSCTINMGTGGECCMTLFWPDGATLRHRQRRLLLELSVRPLFTMPKVHRVRDARTQRG